MIDISLEKNPNLYYDYIECLKFLQNINNKNYFYPDEKVNFHIYSEFRTDKEIVSLMSYFATQNLEKTKIIVWSDYDIEKEPRVQRFKNMIDFRIWDAKTEAMGTILEKENHMLIAADEKHYLQSDLLRLLALHKYGGIWIDMDIILLRDFKPLLDQEYMYMWGSETNYSSEGACASVLSVKKQSLFSIRLLEEAAKMQIIPNSTCWGKNMFAKLYAIYPFTILPATFFNIEWCMNKKTPGSGNHVENGWFKFQNDNKMHMYLETFSWHWHNSSKKNLTIENGSKFDLLTKLTEDRLKERGI
jgi:hypothetical protein